MTANWIDTASAAAALNFFTGEGSKPQPFTEHLMNTILTASPSNLEGLKKIFPELTLAMHLVQWTSDGIFTLRAIASDTTNPGQTVNL